MPRVFKYPGIDALQDISLRSCPAYFPGVVDEARTERLDMPTIAGKVEGMEDLLKHGFKSRDLGANGERAGLRQLISGLPSRLY